MKISKFILYMIFIFWIFTLNGCNKNQQSEQVIKTPQKNEQSEQAAKDSQKNDSKVIKVTFIELGSVKCVPCRMMQPIMKKIEEKYGDQVKVIFYDVWTTAGKPYAYKYRIRVIPTQIFLDKTGNEYFRHQGFFPEEELMKILRKGGVK